MGPRRALWRTQAVSGALPRSRQERVLSGNGDSFFTRATWVLLCVPLSASVTSRSSIETDERIELGFFLAWELLLPILYCVNGKFGYL